jgi:hypothetical protein
MARELVDKAAKASECGSMLDVIIIIDASGAVDDASFNWQKLFAGQLAAPLKTGPTKMAVIMYTGNAVIVSDFTESAEATIVTLAALQRPNGYQRDCAKALAKAEWLLMSGGRGNAESTIFMVVSGTPLNVASMDHMAAQVKMGGTRLMIATVGTRFNQADRAQEWASWPAVANTFDAPFFGNLPKANQVFYDICPIPVNSMSGEPIGGGAGPTPDTPGAPAGSPIAGPPPGKGVPKR